MRIIVVLVAVLLMFSGCGPAPGVGTPWDVNIILLTESPQIIEVSPARTNGFSPSPVTVAVAVTSERLVQYNGGINGSSTGNQFLSETTKVKNHGEGEIFALMVPPVPGKGKDEAFNELKQQFSFVSQLLEDLQSTGSIFTELSTPDPGAEEIMRFVEMFRNDICGGNVDTCLYMRIIGPEENAPVMSNAYVDDIFSGYNQ